MINDNILVRKNDLLESVEHILKGYDFSINDSGDAISVQFAKDIVIGVAVEENGYCIYNISDEWAEKTTYLCNIEEDGTRYYYLDSIDECIGELERIASFENTRKTTLVVDEGTLLSVFHLIENQYLDFVFTNINAKNKAEKDAVYIYSKNSDRRNNVIFEIWRKPRKEKYTLFIKKKFMTNEEWIEAQSSYRTTKKRGEITRVFNTAQELIDFMIVKLNLVKL